MYQETIRATEDQFGDQHLVAAYRTQLETRIRIIGEPLQEFATAIEQLIHCAFPAGAVGAMATFESSLPMRLEEALEPGCH
jgi:hypothetical protein